MMGLIEIVLVGLIGVPMGAIMLRGAIRVANQVVEGKSPAEQVISDGASIDVSVEPSDNPYRPPADRSIVVERRAIPMPRFSTACLIVGTQIIAMVVTNLVVSLLISISGASVRLSVLIAQVVSLGLSLVISARILAVLLPTTYGRALLIAFLQMLIAVALVAVIAAVVAIVAFGVL